MMPDTREVQHDPDLDFDVGGIGMPSGRYCGVKKLGGAPKCGVRSVGRGARSGFCGGVLSLLSKRGAAQSLLRKSTLGKLLEIFGEARTNLHLRSPL